MGCWEMSPSSLRLKSEPCWARFPWSLCFIYVFPRVINPQLSGAIYTNQSFLLVLFWMYVTPLIQQDFWNLMHIQIFLWSSWIMEKREHIEFSYILRHFELFSKICRTLYNVALIVYVFNGSYYKVLEVRRGWKLLGFSV